MLLSTDPFDDDKLREECGVFAITNHEDAARMTALGMHALQHRGQEACGIVSYDGQDFHTVHRQGHVSDHLTKESVINGLKGRAAIGHVRYATTGGTEMRNVQPLHADFEFGGFALAHNGNLTNAATLRKQLVRRGSLFQSTTDTEVIIQLMATARAGKPEDRLIEALRQVEGAFSIVAMAPGIVMGARDALGVRPLVLGRRGESFILASETCALDIVDAEFVRDVEPGELIIINDLGVTSLKPLESGTRRFCIFEYIYFARPDSKLEGISVYASRQNIGRELAREAGIAADVVVPVPDSGVPAALGYAAESKIPFELGIIRNHYVGRTFIEPTDHIRHFGVKRKHNANRSVIQGKRVILVDDSIVRGTTSKKIVDMVRAAGAAEVHMRISSPPTAYPCFYGIDTPEQSKLLAHKYTIEEMCKFIGADSLHFISFDGLYRAMGEEGRNSGGSTYCDACFTGDYPTSLTDRDGQEGAR
jgi:amidophosphoribosyltransferase